MAGISFYIACEEMKIAQIAQVNQLFNFWIYFVYMATTYMSSVVC